MHSHTLASNKGKQCFLYFCIVRVNIFIYVLVSMQLHYQGLNCPSQVKNRLTFCLLIHCMDFYFPFACVQVKMLPTPAKFHYIFNLRDLSRIWEGMLNVEQEALTGLDVLFGLWKHECTRVISDRFTNLEDKGWFDKCVSRVVNEELGEEFAKYVPEEPYFVDFLRDPPEATGEEGEDADLEAPKIYEPVSQITFKNILK